MYLFGKNQIIHYPQDFSTTTSRTLNFTHFQVISSERVKNRQIPTHKSVNFPIPFSNSLVNLNFYSLLDTPGNSRTDEQ